MAPAHPSTTCKYFTLLLSSLHMNMRDPIYLTPKKRLHNWSKYDICREKQNNFSKKFFQFKYLKFFYNSIAVKKVPHS